MATNVLNMLRLHLCLLLACCLTAALDAQPIAIPARDADRDDRPRLLNEDQVNHIKIYEVDLSTRPRITIEDEVLEEFLREFASNDNVPKGRADQREFMRAEGYVQLAKFFEVRARDYYGKALMRGEPDSMRAWHRIHDGYIAEYFRPFFAVGQVEELALFERTRDRTRDRVSYTNFYILTQIRVGGVPMIDRDRPEESLILQWGLPREDAKFPAPEVPNWEPYFRNTEDQRYQLVVEWIKTLIIANRNTDYGITYRVPNYRRPAENE
ncbi:MAG: hypothetical protein AAGC44_01360 [Planctomycetota bacterium]